MAQHCTPYETGLIKANSCALLSVMGEVTKTRVCVGAWCVVVISAQGSLQIGAKSQHVRFIMILGYI